MHDRRVTLVDSAIVEAMLERLLGSAVRVPHRYLDGIDGTHHEAGARPPLSLPSSMPRTGVRMLALRCSRR